MQKGCRNSAKSAAQPCAIADPILPGCIGNRHHRTFCATLPEIPDRVKSGHCAIPPTARGDIFFSKRLIFIEQEDTMEIAPNALFFLLFIFQNMYIMNDLAKIKRDNRLNFGMIQVVPE